MSKHIPQKILLISIFFVILYLFSNALNTYFHEDAHMQINKIFGINSSVNYSEFMQAGETITTPANQAIKGDADLYRKLHSENEIVGYHSIALIFTIVLIGFLIVLFDLIIKK